MSNSVRTRAPSAGRATLEHGTLARVMDAAGRSMDGRATDGREMDGGRAARMVPGRVPIMDPALAKLFGDMRMLLGASQTVLALQLGTTVPLIAALERGEVSALPAEPERSRLIITYATLVNIESRPILTRINDVLGHAAKAQQQPVSAVPTTAAPLQTALSSAPPSHAAHLNAPHLQVGRQPDGPAPARGLLQATQPPMGARHQGPASRLRAIAHEPEETWTPPKPTRAPPAKSKRPTLRDKPRTGPRTGALGYKVVFGTTLPILVAILAFVALQNPSLLYRALRLAPPLLATPARDVLDGVVHQTAPVRDGMKWIDVDDPRTLRQDRLPRK